MVIFLHLSVILFTGGVLPQCMLGCHPPEQTPPPQTTYPRLCTPQTTYPPDYIPPRLCTPQTTYPPGLHTPQTTYPPQTMYPNGLCIPLDYVPPRLRTPQTTYPLDYILRTPPPPRAADSSIRSTSGRYASYWNAFLF